MAHKTGKVWGGKGVGWLSKREEEDAKYANMGSGWPFFIAICRFWPDALADILRSPNATYPLVLIQRILLRIYARYANVDVTGCRGLTKSFCIDIGKYLDALLWPGTEVGIFGPSIKQTAGIARKIYSQIETNYPALTNMLIVERNGEDMFTITTPYKSRVSVEAFRGNTISSVIAEETAQEAKPPFDYEEYQQAVLPQVRGMYKIGNRRSPAYIPYKQQSITSAGRRQQYAYMTRERHRIEMIQGKSAYILDCGIECVLLCQIRDVAWVEKQKGEIGLAGAARELDSIYSGSDKNPIIRDEILSEARTLQLMEEHHCCKDRDNKLKANDVIYIVGYDVSFRDAKGNAKCAVVVVKCTKQSDYYHKDKYLKQVVWVEDWSPSETQTPKAQAQRLRRIWAKYCFEGSQTYIVMDANSYGDGVLTSLMEQPTGGGRPLCCYKHCSYTELELEGSIPVIYPIRAGAAGTKDPDSDIVLNAELQFEHGNVQLLTFNLNDGVEAYKRYHRIKDDNLNAKIAQPYKKTNELVAQIQNLREEPSGQGIREVRISRHIQRDSWSALKYALRFAQKLEIANLRTKHKENGWKAVFRNAGKTTADISHARMVTGRHGGRSIK